MSIRACVPLCTSDLPYVSFYRGTLGPLFSADSIKAATWKSELCVSQSPQNYSLSTQTAD